MQANQNDIGRLKNIKFEAKEIAKTFKSEPESVVTFPYEVLPKKLQDILINVSEFYGINQSFLGGALLFAYSLAIGKTHKLNLMENGSSESAVLYLSLVARPGSNKTGALKFTMKPFYEIEKEEKKSYFIEKREFEEWKLKKPKDRGGELLEEPKLKQFTVSDATIEALAAVHEANPRGIAMVRDELAGLFKDFNKYRNGSDLENYLSNWSGDPIKINRLSRDPISIYDPFISVAGTIQPKVLKDMAKDYLKEGAGFIDRFLFIYPDDQEKALFSNREIDFRFYEDYKKSINQILCLKLKEDDFGNVKSTNVSFTTAALERIFHWLNYENKPLVDNADENLAGIYSKFDIHAQRLCLILHLIKWSYGETEGKEKINLETVNQALILVNFFRSHTDKVQRDINNINPLSGLRDFEKKLYKSIPEHFKIKDIVEISEKFNKKERALRDWINKNDQLFEFKGSGHYRKVF